jgi:hypothetical protein
MGLSKKTVLRVAPLEDRSLPSAAFVTDWNEWVTNVQAARGQGNQAAARALAMMNAAVYNAVNAIHPTHEFYKFDARGLGNVSNASDDAAAAQAAHDVAVKLYSAAATEFDGHLTDQLDELADLGEPGIAEGVALGAYAAAQIVAQRANDGSATPPNVTYPIGSDPGDWQPTAPLYNPIPATPWWPGVKPFALVSGDQFRPGPPPALTSDKYTQAFQEVKALGRFDSTTRTPDQTEMALFWSGLVNGVSVSNAGVTLWTQIAKQASEARHLTLADNARLFAMMNVAAADAFIAGFDAKYAYNYWRPDTAIRAADTDGNPDTVPDANWAPVFPDPNHPSFLSNHSIHGEAVAQALVSFFGTDRFPFTATWAGVTRSFNGFTDAAKEGGKSRLFAGIHWSFDVSAGLQAGRKVGDYVADHFFLPLPDQLTTAAAPSTTVHKSLRDNQVGPVLTEALARWQRAGVDTSALGTIDVHIADLGGLTLGQAADGAIWLDDNAAGWGWFVDRTPQSDSEFIRRGNQGEQNRMDLLTVLTHEVGHLLGHEHEADGVMQETLTAGTRRTPGPTPIRLGDAPSLIAWTDGLVSGNEKKK